MLRRSLALLLAVALLARPIGATWSIILVDVRTGEIAIASATCLANFDLAVGVPVVVVGVGAGAAQSFVDTTGRNRILIRDQLRLGTDPRQILQLLAQQDPGHQTRQYGIVDVSGRAVGFTGSGAGAWAGDRTGRIGDIVYAVQGNVITGGSVLAAAELAIYVTPGGLADKLMAAMEAARAFGGDGRCSCPTGSPTSCGSPPPNFVKSADVGFMIVARPGDRDGSCSAAVGCANGSYYMRLNVAHQAPSAPDPVLQLRGLFEQWKAGERGRPDHALSTFELPVANLPIDGATRVVGKLVLRDREGNRIRHGGASVTVVADPTANATVSPGTVVDNGDGTYDVPLTAGTRPGSARLIVTVDDGSGPRRLMPAPEVLHVLDRLWADRTQLSVTGGGTIRFALQPGGLAGSQRPFVLLASNSGTRPGLFIPPIYTLPLNPDLLFVATVNAAFTGVMPELSGVTSVSGFATTAVTFPKGAYSLPQGSELAFAYVLWNPVTLASNAVVIELLH